MKFATKAIHVGQEPDKTTGAIIPPIYMTSTYVQPSPGKHLGYEYSRTQNPTRSALETCVASLEKMKHGFAFSSGCAAATTVMHLFSSGDHIIVTDDCYGGTNRLFNRVLKQNGLQFDLIDTSNSSLLEATIQKNTKAIWIETPTNPMLKIIDLEITAAIAKKHGLLLIVDNTFMSPFFQNPGDFGADIVVHSATKYLGGHSDVVAGVCMTNNPEIAEKLAFLSNSMGAILGPMDSWLVLRGIKTLALRMERHASNAQAIARYLDDHPKVEKTIYPGLPSHPGHEIAKKQMSGYGGMITFLLKGDINTSRTFLENTHIFALAESLGGVESLIEHPAIMTHAAVPADQRETLGIKDNLIRISVGIEDLSDLVSDLDQAFSAI